MSKLSTSLFSDAERREAFIEALITPVAHPQAIIWCRERPAHDIKLEPALDWQPAFVDRIALAERPGSLDLHSTGHYYCLDFSSVFAASVLCGIRQEIHSVLDMCASPGGKSVYAWRRFDPEVFVANEVIGKRLGALVSNLERVKVAPCIVTSMDSQVYASEVPGAFDLVICDVPCSGQSLLAKGKSSAGCFHPATVNMNSNRQKRIIANSLKTVAPGGYLAYMTCTYSREENEGVIEWAQKKFPQFSVVAVPELSGFQSHLSSFPAYRLWPMSGLGAGSFSVLLRNMEEGEKSELDPDLLRVRWQSC